MQVKCFIIDKDTVKIFMCMRDNGNSTVSKWRLKLFIDAEENKLYYKYNSNITFTKNKKKSVNRDCNKEEC